MYGDCTYYIINFYFKKFGPKKDIINDPIAPIKILNRTWGWLFSKKANAPFNIITISFLPPSNLVTTAAATVPAAPAK
ncbi:MAG: hypothetical protein CM15mP34_2320 [Gammaproteobacteria bacterium]|nr:MAG: hypothetical protein CM15mP34_2320 [Gammaproteobacteria bacterium]